MSSAEYQRAWKLAHPERAAQYQAAWRLRNPGTAAARTRAWVAANRERKRKTDRAVSKRNSRAAVARAAAWAKAHPAIACEKSARRRALKLQASPAWANRLIIRGIYELARKRTLASGFEWHVDHIVPLSSPLVCGLHVEHNLAVVPADVNIEKGNRLWPDMPEGNHA